MNDRDFIKEYVYTIIICIIMAVLTGCSIFEHTGKDGDVTRYFRLGEQSIGVGSVELPGGGKLNFKGQESKLPHVKIGVDSIEIGGKEVVR